MSKSIKSKSETASNNENILYLSENDANALGIFEDTIQRVYVDDREVEVVFVDEHEIIPATNEERKVYQDAENLVKKYMSNNVRAVAANSEAYDDADGSATQRRPRWWDKFKLSNKKQSSSYGYEGSSNYDSQDDYYVANSSRALKPVTKTSVRSMEEIEEYSNNERARRREEILKEREALRRENERLSSAHKDPNRTNKFTVRSDVFTEEELEVLQGIISKSKESNNNVSTKAKKQTKSSKIKTVKRK